MSNTFEPLSIAQVMQRVDWKLLRKQKQLIVAMTWNPDEYNLTQKEFEKLEGLLNFLDAIQDAAVDVDQIATHKEVFGKK